MDLRQRFKIAVKEDVNVLGIAGATALSLVLLNPLPLLVGLVAEVAYLLYIPDSRWYNSRLSRRFDAEVLDRRKSLQNRVFPTLSSTVREKLSDLESARERLLSVTVEPASERRWSELLRQVDYLLEVLTQLCGRQVTIPSAIVTGDETTRCTFGADDPGSDVLESRKVLLAHYDRETEELVRLAEMQKESERRAVLMRSVRDLERDSETIRQELFQLGIAQNLGYSVWKAMQDTEYVVCAIPGRLQMAQGTVTTLYTEVHQLVQSVERIAQHQNDWLKQSAAGSPKKA